MQIYLQQQGGNCCYSLPSSAALPEPRVSRGPTANHGAGSRGNIHTFLFKHETEQKENDPTKDTKSTQRTQFYIAIFQGLFGFRIIGGQTNFTPRPPYLIFVFFLHNRNLRPRNFTLESAQIRNKCCLATKLSVKLYTACKAVFFFQLENLILNHFLHNVRCGEMGDDRH